MAPRKKPPTRPPEKRVRPKNGFLSEIPETVLLVGLQGGVHFFFPSSKLPLRFPKPSGQESMLAALKDPYLIVAPMLQGGGIFYVGVLGKVAERHNYQEYDTANFTGIIRVQYQHTKQQCKGYQIVRWYPLLDIPIAPEMTADLQFLQSLEHLKELFEELFDRVKEEGSAHTRALLAKPFVADVLARVAELDYENLSHTLDGILNIINFLQPMFMLDISEPLCMNIAENNVHLRLGNVIVLLEALKQVEFHEGDEEENPAEDTSSHSSSQETSHQPIDPPSPPEPPSSEKKDQPASKARNQIAMTGRERLQKQLQEPLIIPSRFSIKTPRREPRRPLIPLDWKTPSRFMQDVISALDQYIVGQPRGKLHIARNLVLIRQGLVDPRRPNIGGFFPGPSEVGKTETVKALAKTLFGDFLGYTHIPCNMFQSQHEAAFLIGAPPGYIGFGEQPLLSQWRIDQPHFISHIRKQEKAKIEQLNREIEELEDRLRESESEEGRLRIQQQLRPKYTAMKKLFSESKYTPGQYFSIVLWDEIEKAPPHFFNLQLQMLDDGRFPLLNGTVTDFRNSMFFYTSNIYAKEIQEMITGRGRIGFKLGQPASVKEEFEKQMFQDVIRAHEKFFSFNPAFWSRVGKENVEVFHPLERGELLEMMDKIYFNDFLERLQERVEVGISEAAKLFLIDEAYGPNRAAGGRAMHRVFTRLVELPVALLIDKGEQGGVAQNDFIWIDVAENEDGSKKLVVSKEQRSS